ncbi:hypothetical protein [Lysinibacillus sp. NPDC092081]|uniref:hypothetical protein n=1 Tax=Lysinibacillus sp. NPDC092081 TaxID=3364131 RepID=UPI0037F80604
MSTVFLNAIFPGVPHALWIILLTATIVIPSILGVKFTASTGKIFVIAQVIFVFIFWILTIKSLLADVGAVTLFSIQPLFNAEIKLPVILAGASILCFSFLGFDSLTTLSEETMTTDEIKEYLNERNFSKSLDIMKIKHAELVSNLKELNEMEENIRGKIAYLEQVERESELQKVIFCEMKSRRLLTLHEKINNNFELCYGVLNLENMLTEKTPILATNRRHYYRRNESKIGAF